MESLTLAKKIAGICVNQKALDTRLYDMTGKSSEADFWIVCGGMSTTHVRGISEKVHVEIKKKGIYPLGIEGEAEQIWILMDYNDVIIEVFEENNRIHYDIDALFQERGGKEVKFDEEQDSQLKKEAKA